MRIRSYEDAGLVIRRIRKDQGITQKELAERTGIKQPSISRFESGRMDARVHTFVQLLKGLGHEIDVQPNKEQAGDVESRGI